jgi:hypothetical protein
MRATRPFATSAITLILLIGLAPARAGTVTTVILNNLDQQPEPTAPSAFVGQSFIAGTGQPLYGAQMQLDPSAPPSSAVTLEVEARNADGTLGQTLFSNFSSSYSPTTGLITFLATSPFEMTADTGYWLVLSDPVEQSVTWEFTASQVYQSSFGYGLPSYDTAYYSNLDNGLGNAMYYQPSDGPQMFDLITAPVVEEPSSLILMGLAAAIGVLALRFQGSQASRRPRPQVALCPKVVHP